MPGKGLVILIVLLYCRDATSGTVVKYLQLGSSGCFCCPAISHCSPRHFHNSNSSTVKWYRCGETELADSCQQLISEQLSIGSAWAGEVGEICFSNFTRQAIGTYCCTPRENAEQCVMMSVLVSVRPVVAAVENRLAAQDDGSMITMECKRLVEGAPDPYMFWRYNGIVVTNGNKYQIMTSANSTKLTITNVTSSDSGVYVCAAIVLDMESSSQISLNVSDPPSVLSDPLFIRLHNRSVGQPAEVTSQVRTSLQSYLNQHHHGISIVLDWLLPCCCNSDSNMIYKFRLTGTQAVRVSHLLVHNIAQPTTINEYWTVSSCAGMLCCRMVTPPSGRRASGDTSNIDELTCSGIAVLGVVLVCLIVMVVVNYQCYRKKTRSRTKQVIQVSNSSTRDYNRLSHLSNSQPATSTNNQSATAAPDYYLPLQSPTRTNH